MAKIKVIKKNDEYSSDYKVGDILEVTGTWYGGFNVNSVTGIPLCLDKDECEEILEKTDLSHEEYEEAASYWKKKDAESVKLDDAKLKNLSSIRIITVHSGCFPKAARSLPHWKRISMCVWPFLINMRALAN